MPILLLPIQSVLLRTATCDGDISAIGTGCFQGAHIPLAIVSVLMWTANVGGSMFLAAVLFDRNPLSRSLGARAHGKRPCCAAAQVSP